MNPRDELLVTFMPKSSRWMLPPSETGQLVMIGWRIAEGRPIDAGIPPLIAGVLGSAFTRSSWVSFFDASEPLTSARARVGKLVASDLGEQVRAVMQHVPRTVFQISTREREIAVAAFDARLFSWSMQGQVLLLSAPEHPPRVLTWVEMWSLISRERSITSAVLDSFDIEAALFPGVDGDVAGLVSSNRQIETRIVAALQSAAEAADVEWRVVSEEAFIRAI